MYLVQFHNIEDLDEVYAFRDTKQLFNFFDYHDLKKDKFCKFYKEIQIETIKPKKRLLW